MLRELVATTLLIAMIAGSSACSGKEASDKAASPAASGQALTPDSDHCGASKANRIVGRPDVPELHAELRTLVGHANIRWIHPGEVVTQDYVPARLNVIVGPDNKVATVRCG